MSENRREYFRVFFDYSIDGDIIRQGDGSLSVKIENISVGGLRFTSSYILDLEEKVICSFNIFNSSFSIDGLIVHKYKKSNYTEYGVMFNIDPDTFSQLFKQLNYYQMRQIKGFEE